MEKIADKLDLILSLLINLLLVISWIVTRVNEFLKKRVISNFFGSEKINIYFPGRDLGRKMPVIAAEDFYAAYHLAEFLRKHQITVELKHIPPDSKINFEPGSIVICGPKTSSRIKEILDTDPCYKFKEESGIWKFVETATNNELISPSDKNPAENKDIAYLGRLKLSVNDPNFVTIIAGIHAIGSYGIVHYITNLKTLKQIDRVTNNQRFSTLISTYYDPRTLEILSSGLQMPIKTH